ncbi:unnamed protein product [Hyaloperonospora brassicae]|uniref:Centrosomal protein of 70 kDa n=1 Tax=Hyaloperonospora brassicae TaxID=162125 RepID=A0AAV0UKE5_HYABA|nr:unnamed protein product [Hyaloperonospora brassicae]
MDDERLSSVDQFLRENGFSISDSALAIASLSDDDILDDDLLLSAADAYPTPSGCSRRSSSSSSSSSNATDPPRFMLLDDESLLTERQDDERLSGDRTSERPEDDGAVRFARHEHEAPAEAELLDQSSGMERYEFILSSSAAAAAAASHGNGTQAMDNARSRLPSSVASSSSQPRGDDNDDGACVAMVSEASSASLPSSRPLLWRSCPSRSSGDRELDDELNDALGVSSVVKNGAERLGLLMERSRQEEAEEQNGASGVGSGPSMCHSRSPKVERALFTDVEVDAAQIGNSSDRNESGARLESVDVKCKSRRNTRSSGCREDAQKSDVNDYASDECETTNCGERRKREDAANLDEGAWNGLNDLLRRNGLSALRFRRVGSEAVPEQESLFSVIHDFGVQLEWKNKTIEDLLLTSQHNSRVRSRLERKQQCVVKKNEEAQKALEKAKAEIQRLEALQKKERESTEVLSRKLKTSCLRLQQQLKASEHRVKAKEIVVDRMQAKLQLQADNETMKRARDRHAFRNLQNRDPRRANLRDTQTLETISVYEAQREQMEEEIDDLKSQVAALNIELRDKDNHIARQSSAFAKHQPAVWEQDPDERHTGHFSGFTSPAHNVHCRSSSVASDEAMLEQLEAARCEQELAATKLRRREVAMMKKIAMIERELLASRETVGELKTENANLKLELKSRPSIRDYRCSQRRTDQLERQIEETKVALEEAVELNGLRKNSEVKKCMEHDRVNCRSQRNRLDKFSRESVVEVMKHICRVLHLSDIALIVPSIEKLCSVVAAVPRMEKFIRDVCRLVSLHSEDNGEAACHFSSSTKLEQVLPTLQVWVEERRKLHALEKFKTSIIAEIGRRTVESTVFNDEEGSSRDENAPSDSTALSYIVHVVSELVELEKSVMYNRDTRVLAAGQVERHPKDRINQIVRHFAYLFQVRNVEGILPTMNETYLLVNEMKNFVHAVRDILHLKKGSSLVHCLDVIRERLQKSAVDTIRVRAKEPSSDDAEQDYASDDSSLNFVVEKYRPSAHDKNSGSSLAGVREVREMSILIRDLQRELGATAMDDILPRTQRLMELLRQSIYDAGGEDDDEEYERSVY